MCSFNYCNSLFLCVKLYVIYYCYCFIFLNTDYQHFMFTPYFNDEHA